MLLSLSISYKYVLWKEKYRVHGGFKRTTPLYNVFRIRYKSIETELHTSSNSQTLYCVNVIIRP
jgi:hypothetical protein